MISTNICILEIAMDSFRFYDVLSIISATPPTLRFFLCCSGLNSEDMLHVSNKQQNPGAFNGAT